MASTKRTAKKPEDLDVDGALKEAATEGKATGSKRDPKAFRLYPNSTFAQRVKAVGKRVGAATNKAISADESDAK